MFLRTNGKKNCSFSEPIVDSNDIANNKTNDADHDLRGA